MCRAGYKFPKVVTGFPIETMHATDTGSKDPPHFVDTADDMTPAFVRASILRRYRSIEYASCLYWFVPHAATIVLQCHGGPSQLASRTPIRKKGETRLDPEQAGGLGVYY
jgi:hypothetical protein